MPAPKAKKTAPKKAKPRVTVEHVEIKYTEVTFKGTDQYGSQGNYKLAVGPAKVKDSYGGFKDIPAGKIAVIAPCGEVRKFEAADLKQVFEALS